MPCICRSEPDRCVCGSGYCEPVQSTSAVLDQNPGVSFVALPTTSTPIYRRSTPIEITPPVSTLSPLATEFVPKVFNNRSSQPVAITVGEPVLVMDAWDEKWRVSHMAVGLFDWDRVLAHPGLYKKARRKWAQALSPEEKLSFRNDKLTNQRGLKGTDANACRQAFTSRRRGSSARRKSTRRKSRRPSNFKSITNSLNSSEINHRGERPKSRKLRRQAHVKSQSFHAVGAAQVDLNISRARADVGSYSYAYASHTPYCRPCLSN